MESAASRLRGYRFGPFELDLVTNELRKNGQRVRLPDQPLAVLRLLLERNPELVTREDIKRMLWSEDTFVDFDRAINTAVWNLRDALGDDAENPLFVKTVPKKGFRFVGSVELIAVEPPPPPPVLAPPARPRTQLRWWMVALAATLIGAAPFVWEWMRPMVSHHGPITIAVVQFENLSGNPVQDYVAGDVTQQLITKLGQLDPTHLVVVTANPYTSKDDPVKVGRQLRVENVVSGSALLVDGELEINARLINTRDGSVTWTLPRYKRNIGDILDTINNVTQEIAVNLQLKLGPQRKEKSASPQAVEALMQGRYFMNRRSGADLQRSLFFLQAANAADPNSAQAHAAMASLYDVLGFWSVLEPNKAFPSAKLEAQTALKLDPYVADAYVALGDAAYIYDHDWNTAEIHFQKAILLNPSSPLAHDWYGIMLASQGKNEQAIAEVSKAQQLEPFSLTVNLDLGLCYYYARQYDKAMAQYNKTLELDPAFFMTHSWMGMTLMAMKRYDEGVAQLRQGVDNGGGAGPLALLAFGYGTAGQLSDAHQALDQLEARARQGYVSPAFLSIAYIGVRDYDRVWSYGEKSLDDHAAWLARLKVDPIVDPVRGDARYPKLVRQIGLTP